MFGVIFCCFVFSWLSCLGVWGKLHSHQCRLYLVIPPKFYCALYLFPFGILRETECLNCCNSVSLTKVMFNSIGGCLGLFLHFRHLDITELSTDKWRKQTEKLTEQDTIPVSPASDSVGRRIIDLKKTNKQTTENHDDKLSLMWHSERSMSYKDRFHGILASVFLTISFLSCKTELLDIPQVDFSYLVE